jgi:magnesium transporter
VFLKCNTEFDLLHLMHLPFSKLVTIRREVDSILDKVDNNDITSPDAVVHQLAPLKDALQSFEIQVRQSLECLEHILTHDDEMLALLLTEQNAAHNDGRSVDFSRHEHVELLLGVYARQISNVNMEINYLLQRLQSKQEFVALALSGYRNRMVQMNVHLGISALSLGLSTTVAGFFGMNLLHGFETSNVAFATVVLLSCTSSLITWTLALNHLSGAKMRQRAKQRLDEMETLTNALSDMCALDHTLKTTVERGEVISKEQFRVLLQNARQYRTVTPREVDLLFDVFDKIKDGTLAANDFPNRQIDGMSQSHFGRLDDNTK